MSKTHWKSGFEFYDQYKQTERPTFIGAACKGPDQDPSKHKIGTKEEVDCKTCIRMRERLRAKAAALRASGKDE